MNVPDSDPKKEMLKAFAVSIASNTPVMGMFVDAAVSVLDARQRQKDEEFWAHVYARGTLTDERLEAIARGEDDVFLATAQRIIHEHRQTADNEKRAFLASLLANSGSWSATPYDEREELLPIALRLTGAQALVLQFFGNPGEWIRSRGIEDEVRRRLGGGGSRMQQVTKCLGEGDAARITSITRATEALSREGLITPMLHTSMTFDGLMNPALVDLGARLLRYIE